ncbi:hypothetical protein EJC51_20520 [Streptomyces aquilus]|uniref:Ribbon-helix-helix protein, CopG family n=1 Tax=Streptomyces aquilus TaxID=2548456 RepID=A0A3S9I1U5_9ACTN|nr:hypothetical protein [Streptomyces aquilus]AZP18262.1 hypothetical protein EJC51_20520 [Streptomyces aquilus]
MATSQGENGLNEGEARGLREGVRVTLRLNPRSVEAIKQVEKIHKETRTDIINRAVQLYAMVENAVDAGGGLYLRPSKGAPLERLTIL